MKRSVVGVVLGLIAGFVVVGVVEGASSFVYGSPQGFDFSDTKALREFVGNLPVGAFFFIIAAHVLGSFTAAMTCSAIVRTRWLTCSLIVGSVLLVAGVANLVMIPHPLWFSIVDVLVYLPSAIAGGKVACVAFGLNGSTRPSQVSDGK